MKTFLLIMTFFCSFSLEANHLYNNEFVQKGDFSCKMNGYILFFENSSLDDETPSYTLRSIDIHTKKQMIIANSLSCETCVKITDDVIAFTNGKKIICFNLKTKVMYDLLQADIGCYINGIGIDSSGNKLLEIQVEYKKYRSLVKVINTKTKEKLFQQYIKLNRNEMEGIVPLIQTTKDFFIFSEQYDFYAIPINRKPEMKLISDNLFEFAINNTGVIFYNLVTEETTEGFFLNFQTWTKNKIDPSFNKKIVNFQKSFLITANQDENLVPYYIVSGIPYVYSDNRWKLETNVVIYSDKQLEICLNRIGNNKIDESKFVYKILD